MNGKSDDYQFKQLDQRGDELVYAEETTRGVVHSVTLFVSLVIIRLDEMDREYPDAVPWVTWLLNAEPQHLD